MCRAGACWRGANRRPGPNRGDRALSCIEKVLARFDAKISKSAGGQRGGGRAQARGGARIIVMIAQSLTHRPISGAAILWPENDTRRAGGIRHRRALIYVPENRRAPRAARGGGISAEERKKIETSSGGGGASSEMADGGYESVYTFVGRVRMASCKPALAKYAGEVSWHFRMAVRGPASYVHDRALPLGDSGVGVYRQRAAYFDAK